MNSFEELGSHEARLKAVLKQHRRRMENSIIHNDSCKHPTNLDDLIASYNGACQALRNAEESGRN